MILVSINHFLLYAQLFQYKQHNYISSKRNQTHMPAKLANHDSNNSAQIDQSAKIIIILSQRFGEEEKDSNEISHQNLFNNFALKYIHPDRIIKILLNKRGLICQSYHEELNALIIVGQTSCETASALVQKIPQVFQLPLAFSGKQFSYENSWWIK